LTRFRGFGCAGAGSLAALGGVVAALGSVAIAVVGVELGWAGGVV